MKQYSIFTKQKIGISVRLYCYDVVEIQLFCKNKRLGMRNNDGFVEFLPFLY